MIKYEEARTEINKLRGKEAANNIVQVREQYNLYVLNDNDVIATKLNKNINNLVWYSDLSGAYMSRKDLFEDTKKELVIDGYKLTAETFKRIDNDVNLSRFDYLSAFHLVCKKVKESVENVVIV